MKAPLLKFFSQLVLGIALLGHIPSLFAQPAGFVDQTFMSGFVQAVGITFDANERMYVWEKRGLLWTIDGGVKAATPLLDITEEIGDYSGYGLVGLALDPNFLSNGYIYCFYVVDRHHLLYYGTPSYNENVSVPYNATIGRITRFTAEASTGFTTVDYSSRKVLLGETKETGIPILHVSHGVGTLAFAEDGTLLASCGDGASFNGDDLGGGNYGDYAVQALIDGILTPDQDVGAFRSQQLNSLNGKVLRIDPNTGEGISTNPFYEPGDPGSVRSRVWALGLRNPYRMSIKPGTGSHYATDGNPGTLYIGDVGSGTWEELNISDRPAVNFGWPLYEGMSVSPGYMNPNVEDPYSATPGGCGQSYYRFNQLLQNYDGDSTLISFDDPCNPGSEIDGSTYDLFVHQKPALDWKHGSSGWARSAIDGVEEIIGVSSPVKGNTFFGNASVSGIWYDHTDFPEEYRGLYYHGDYGAKWIRTMKFDGNDVPDSTAIFDNTVERVVALAAKPSGGGIYYLRYATNTVIRHITYTGSINQPPEADITSDIYYTSGASMSVNFDATGSTDPENAALTYTWDFGDGNVGSGATPTHNYGPVVNSTMYTATVTVTDTGGLSSSANMIVSLKNTPPVINSTSLDGITEYSIVSATPLDLTADVDDAEQTDESLTFAWQTILYHDDHNHPEPIDYTDTTSTLVSPIGCDGPTYYYRVYLTVTDTAGLSASTYREIHPRCAPLVVSDVAEYTSGGTVVLHVLDNDYSEDGFDSTTLAIATAPTIGNAVVNNAAGTITYTHTGPGLTDDSFSYTIEDTNGDISQEALVEVNWIGEPRIDIIDPKSGLTLDDKVVRFTYQISGDTTLMDHIELIHNNQTPIDLVAPFGAFSLAELGVANNEVRLQMVDAGSNPLSFTTSRDTVDFLTRKVGEAIKFEVGTLSNVGSSWTTVNLPQTYNDMVVIATPVYPNTSALPAVARVRNASGNSFQVKVQNPGDASLTGYGIHYIVAEVGIYTDGADGIKMEVLKATTSATAYRYDWIHEPRAYVNSYLNPVVVGQVMTENDVRWSNFWTSYNSRTNPPTVSQFNAGHHVGQDTITTRNSETIGYIVMETGNGIIRGRPYSIGNGGKTVAGIYNSPTGFDYGVGGIGDPEVAVLTSGGVSSIEGSWPVLIGPNPVDGAIVTLSLDEDQIVDTERNLGYSGAAYLVFDHVISWDATTFPVEFLDFTATPLSGTVLLKWATASEESNSFFGIERSVDGTIFDELKRVSSQGNSTNVQQYQTVDPSPISGRSYYRLRQVDLDGTTSYSNIVEVNFENTAFNVSPNPVNWKEDIEVKIYLAEQMPIDLKLYNSIGQEVYSKLMTNPGAGQIIRIPTAQLPMGTYILRLNAGESYWHERIVLDLP